MGQKEKNIEKYTWEEFDKDVKKIVKWLKNKKFSNIYGVPRGGLPLAVKLSNILKKPLVIDEKKISKETLIVDDISDTGETLAKFKGHLIVTLFYHKQTKTLPDFWIREKTCDWIIFPWEE